MRIVTYNINPTTVFTILSNKLNIQIIRVYGIPGHGKNEVDCCSGVAKIAIRNEVSKGKPFSSAEDRTNFLSNKFANFIDPKYMFKVINSEELNVSCKADQKIQFKPIKGWSQFRVVIFTPKSSFVKVAPYLCICERCLVQIGSCELYGQHELISNTMKGFSLRSE